MLDRTQSWPPNYLDHFEWRQAELQKLRADPVLMQGAKVFYRTHPIEFIEDWCDTFDPRNAAAGKLTRMPFLLFPRQREFIEFLHECLKAEAHGLVEKSRDMGATWLCIAFSVWLFLFTPGANVGWGSRKGASVDRIGDMNSIFEKIRALLRILPPEFLPDNFGEDQMSLMKIYSLTTGNSITGESGDDIGRGGRTLVYFKDESAHYEHPEAIEASLSDNTRIQIDISSVNGLGNVFHRKREAGKEWESGKGVVRSQTNVFVFDWSDHPAKTQSWYDERKTKATGEGLLHIFAQEVDRSYSASIEGVVIPAEWVTAAIDAHLKLDFRDDGGWCAALDVADEGGDTNALAKRKGVVLKSVEEWGERDTGVTARRAVVACTGLGNVDLQYDCIGVGAGIKAETNRLRDEKLLPRGLNLVPWNAGAEVLYKDKHVIPHDKSSPLNGDFYANLKAQAWWQTRRRFEITYRAVRSLRPDATPDEKSFTWDVEDLISISSDIPLLRKLQKELSQATMSQTTSKLKLIIDKSPEGTKSPNLADSIIMVFWPTTPKRLVVHPGVLVQARHAPRHGLMGTRRPRL